MSNSPNYRGISRHKSFLNNLLDVCLYMERIYAFLVKYQSDGILLFKEKYVNHSNVYNLKDYLSGNLHHSRETYILPMSDSWEK